MTPEVRQDILDSLTRTCELWLYDVMRGYFEPPHSAFAIQLTLEAFAAALTRMASKTPEGDAVMQTYLLELLDRSKDTQ